MIKSSAISYPLKKVTAALYQNEMPMHKNIHQRNIYKKI